MSREERDKTVSFQSTTQKSMVRLLKYLNYCSLFSTNLIETNNATIQYAKCINHIKWREIDFEQIFYGYIGCRGVSG